MGAHSALPLGACLGYGLFRISGPFSGTVNVRASKDGYVNLDVEPGPGVPGAEVVDGMAPFRSRSVSDGSTAVDTF
jgi:hypothetical protein